MNARAQGFSKKLYIAASPVSAFNIVADWSIINHRMGVFMTDLSDLSAFKTICLDYARIFCDTIHQP